MAEQGVPPRKPIADPDGPIESLGMSLAEREDLLTQQPWRRLVGESDEAFALFEVYRTLDPWRRTVAEVARQTGTSKGRLYRYSTGNHWKARACAWDEHAQHVRAAETEQAIRDMARRHVTQTSYVQAIVSRHLSGMTAQLQAEEEQSRAEGAQYYLPAQLNPDQLIKWLKVGQDLEAVRQAQLLALERGDARTAINALLSGEATTEEQWRAIYVEPERVWIPHHKQRDLIHSEARFCASVAGVQSGKTSGTAITFWRRILDDKKVLGAKGEAGFYWLIAPNSIVGEVMCEAFEQFAPPGQIVEVKGRASGKTWTLKDGTRVQFRSAERADQLVGRRVHGCWLDEFTLMKPEIWTTSVRQRLATTGGWALFSGTPRGKNWAWEEIWRRTDPNDDNYDEDYEGFTWYSEENPRISTKEIEAAKRQLPDAYFQREYRASWESFHGQIYAEWSSDKFRIKKLATLRRPDETYTTMGVDWGMAKPGCLVVVAHLPTGAKHVLDEIHVADKLPGWWSDKITEKWAEWQVERIWCDPEDPGRIGELAKLGLPALKADNAVLEGIRTVALLIKQSQLYVDHDNAPVLAQQLESYTWHEDSRGNRREFPKKVNDHAADAVRYAIHSETTKDVLSVERSGYKGPKAS